LPFGNNRDLEEKRTLTVRSAQEKWQKIRAVGDLETSAANGARIAIILNETASECKKWLKNAATEEKGGNSFT
jgi:hypothetical protein